MTQHQNPKPPEAAHSKPGQEKLLDEKSPPESNVDEVDASPEEQLTRHHVELDVDKLPSHHHHQHHHGALENLKEKAKTAIEHLPSSITLSSLKFTSKEQEEDKKTKKDDVESFPETLQEAISDGTIGNDTSTKTPKKNNNNKNAEEEEIDVEGAGRIAVEPTPPDPFQGRSRSKL